jgi:hypothetical protein
VWTHVNHASHSSGDWDCRNQLSLAALELGSGKVESRALLVSIRILGGSGALMKLRRDLTVPNVDFYRMAFGLQILCGSKGRGHCCPRDW